MASASTHDRLVFSSESEQFVTGRGNCKQKTVVRDPSLYNELPNNYRHILSNYHEAPFECDGHTWMTVEHYYHSRKFILENPEFAVQTFAISYNDQNVIARDPNIAKSVGGKTGIVSFKKLEKYTVEGLPGSILDKKCHWDWKRPTTINPDRGFFSPDPVENSPYPTHPTWTAQNIALIRGLYAKFSFLGNERFKHVLLATRDAELWHQNSRSVAFRFLELEIVRKALRENEILV